MTIIGAPLEGLGDAPGQGSTVAGALQAQLAALPDWLAALTPVNGEKHAYLPGWPEKPQTKDQIRAEITAGRCHAVGVICGPASGLLVLDHDGQSAHALLHELTGGMKLPTTWRWTSGRIGRWSAAYRVPERFWSAMRGKWSRGTGIKAPDDPAKEEGLELRWKGHQSVLIGAHPSQPDGYRWFPDRSPAELPEPAEAPLALIEALLQERQVPEPLPLPLLDLPAPAPSGLRLPLLEFVSRETREFVETGGSPGQWNDSQLAHAQDLIGTERWIQQQGHIPEPSARDAFADHIAAAIQQDASFDSRKAWRRFDGGLKLDPHPSTPPDKLQGRLAFHAGRAGAEPPQASPQRPPRTIGSSAAKDSATKPQELTFAERWAALEARAHAISGESWPLMKAVASLASHASELELHRLTARNLEQLLEAAHRRQRPTAAPLMPGASFAVRSTPWAVDGLFRHGVNLLVGQPGAGKSRLSAAGIAAWLRADRTWLGREMPCDLPPEQRHALIVGTDQPLEDWAITLEPVGLVQRLSSGEVRLHPRLTLHSLETGTALDTDGLATIRRWCDAHPHGVVLVDSLAACLPPGIDEDKSAVARPVHALAETIGTCWAVLTHHSRKAAGKDQNLGVGAGRGSSAIDGAVSRVIGLGLIHKMENGVLTPQESDPRRELLSTKRGGATLHLIVRSDASGFWSNEGSAEDLKRQERKERTLAGLTDAQADVLAVLEDATSWLTGRQVVEGLLAPGEEYDNRGVLAAGTRKILKRLEVVGLIETQKVGRDRMFRLAGSGDASGQESNLARDESKEGGSNCSNTAPHGISPALMPARPGSDRLYSAPEPPEQAGEQVEPLRVAGEQAGDQAKPTAPQHECQESTPPLHASDGTGSTPARITVGSSVAKWSAAERRHLPGWVVLELDGRTATIHRPGAPGRCSVPLDLLVLAEPPAAT